MTQCGVSMCVLGPGSRWGLLLRKKSYSAARAKTLGISRTANGVDPTGHMIDCTERADECRRLAKLRAGSEHWAAFLEMAETWDQLAKLQEQSRRLKSAGILKTKMPAAVVRIESAVRDLEQRTSDQE
jgi:hypothetical protein